MGQAIGDLLPSAIGVALSPLPIIAVILMLGTPRATSNGPAFAVGWVAGLVIVAAVVLLLTNGADEGNGSTSDATGWLKVVLGVLFLMLARQQWRGRPRPGAQPVMPKWMATIDEFTTGKALGLGALLSGLNPKNLALTVAAAATLADAGLSAGGNVVAVAVFVVIASVTVVGPVVVYLVAKERSARWLASLEAFMAAHNAVIMMVLFLVLGAKLIGDGIGALSD